MNTMRALARVRPTALWQPRRHAGGHSNLPSQNVGHFDVKKNFFVEEWNGKREITEKTFDYTSTNVPMLIATLAVFPAFVFALCKTELQNSGNTCINAKINKDTYC
eukprot:CAMPEP_0185766832 /NCGR_PEP_ID=MMETSP1174-20130828/39067_1 /TAXON_ID=35687 /ORGANISM="Dictyocha speculum, Strain CCMP1381" /LENGTH=105 /DNA_ID=CAMNT_0028450681 /DNA_START=21 /DNA_END=338 /DNA_ORIENTATION=+